MAFASASVGAIHLDGLAVRRHVDGRIAVSLPEHRSRRGRRFRYVELDPAVLAELEAEILSALDREGWS